MIGSLTVPFSGSTMKFKIKSSLLAAVALAAWMGPVKASDRVRWNRHSSPYFPFETIASD